MSYSAPYNSHMHYGGNIGNSMSFSSPHDLDDSVSAPPSSGLVPSAINMPIYARRSTMPIPPPITDEDGYSDDDELSDDDSLLEAYREHAPTLPATIKNQRIAVTGIFSSIPHHVLRTSEIPSQGAFYSPTVTAATTLLLAPHPHPRSKKAYEARRLGIPIMDEVSYLRIKETSSSQNVW